jgi:2-polyprenyl-3-methyl-5-hydroxy-6-metoxy-1,4-benzoquinol methylase
VRCFPEFQEYFVHYPIKHSRSSSHAYARRMVGSNHDVLDIGAGEGFFAAELAANGNRVTGIDNRLSPVETARFERYFTADLEAGIGQVIRQLEGQRFDRVLLLDVLEHLRRPEQILRQAHEVLKRQGLLIVSLPNIANIYVRLTLLFGRFDYSERGLLDKTHVRFFTRKTARRLLESNGYAIVEEAQTVIPLELVLGWKPDNLVMRALNRVLAIATWMFPGLFGYQVMFVARAAISAPAHPE